MGSSYFCAIPAHHKPVAGKPGRPGGIPGSRPPGGLVGWLVGWWDELLRIKVWKQDDPRNGQVLVKCIYVYMYRYYIIYIYMYAERVGKHCVQRLMALILKRWLTEGLLFLPKYIMQLSQIMNHLRMQRYSSWWFQPI